MTNPELLNFMAKVKGLFPQAELTAEQAEMWARKVRHADYRAAVAALEDNAIEQDGRNRRRPNLHAILKAISFTNAPRDGQRPTPSLAEAVRSQRPELKERPDYEVLLRHWRAEWHAYLARADTRRQNIGATLLREHDRRGVAFRRRTRAACIGSLVAAGMVPDAAARYARAALRADAEKFRLVLDDVQCYGALVTAAA